MGMKSNDFFSESEKEKAFLKFLERKNSDDKQQRRLQRRLLEYLIAKVRKKNLNVIPKKLLFKIENQLEEMVDSTINETLDEFKKIQIDEIISKEEDDHIEKYELPRKSNNIRIINEAFEEHFHFEKYE